MFHNVCGRPSGAVVREAGCCIKDSVFESRVRHGNSPSLDQPVAARFCALKLVDGKCQIQSPVVLVDLAARSFQWFSPKLA